MQNRKRHYIIYSIFVVFAFFFIFHRLDYPSLWQDEAEVALLGKRIMTFGVPKVWDGRNLITQHGSGQKMDSYDFNSKLLPSWLPWPQFYIAAGSMSILGNTALACRLPFAIIGFLAFLFFLYFCEKYLRLDCLYYLPGLLLLFSVPFFLHVRQCRYYSFNIILMLLFVDSFFSLMKRKKYSDLYFSIVGTAFVFNNPLAFMPTLFAFLLYILLNPKKRFDFKCVGRGGGFLGFGLLLFAAFKIYLEIDTSSLFAFTLKYFFSTLLSYANVINSWCFPFIVLIILLILAIINRNKIYRYEISGVLKNKTLHLFGLIIISHIALLSFMVQIDFRYIVPILPLILIFLAQALFLIYKENRAIYILVLCSLLFTDILGRGITRLPFFALATIVKKNKIASASLTSGPFKKLIASFARTSVKETPAGEIINADEILRNFVNKYEKFTVSHPFLVFLVKTTKPYPDVNTCIVGFLVKNAKKEDTVLVNYGDLSIMFHTSLLTRGGFRGVGLFSDKTANKRGIFKEDWVPMVRNPDWVIIRNGWGFQDVLSEIIKKGNYKKIELDCPDLQWGYNPDPNYYIYEDFSKYSNVSIYKRRH